MCYFGSYCAIFIPQLQLLEINFFFHYVAASLYVTLYFFHIMIQHVYSQYPFNQECLLNIRIYFYLLILTLHRISSYNKTASHLMFDRVIIIGIQKYFRNFTSRCYDITWSATVLHRHLQLANIRKNHQRVKKKRAEYICLLIYGGYVSYCFLNAVFYRVNRVFQDKKRKKSPCIL